MAEKNLEKLVLAWTKAKLRSAELALVSPLTMNDATFDAMFERSVAVQDAEVNLLAAGTRLLVKKGGAK